MLKGVNNSEAEARELVRLIAGMPAKVNLIPFNPWPGSRFETSGKAALDRFAAIVNAAGFASPIRTPRGPGYPGGLRAAADGEPTGESVGRRPASASRHGFEAGRSIRRARKEMDHTAHLPHQPSGRHPLMRRNLQLEKPGRVQPEDLRALGIVQTRHRPLDRLGRMRPRPLMMRIVVRPREIVDQPETSPPDTARPGPPGTSTSHVRDNNRSAGPAASAAPTCGACGKPHPSLRAARQPSRSQPRWSRTAVP